MSIVHQNGDAHVITPSAPFFEALAQRRAFILSRLVPKEGGGFDKVPTHHETGHPISVMDQTYWMTPNMAQGWLAANDDPTLRLGMVLLDGLVCIDIDHCALRDAQGNHTGWSNTALAVCRRFPGAAREVSQSGAGLHLFFHVKNSPPHGKKNLALGIEGYTDKRHIMLSGNPITGDVLADYTEEWAAFVAEYLPPSATTENGDWTDTPELPAADFARAIETRKREFPLFAALIDADMDALAAKWSKASGGCDQSEADFMLCCELLTLNGGNCGALLEHMQGGGLALARSKWDERYLRRTIGKAYAKIAPNLPANVGFGKGPRPAGMSDAPLPAHVPAGTPIPSAVGTVEEWPDPLDFFAGKLEAPPFDGSEFSTDVAAYPLLYAQQTGFDRSIVLNASLTAMAAGIPDQIQICADSESRWFQQARLWQLTIAGPGAGKSPAQREMLTPLWQLHQELNERWRAAVAAQPEGDEAKIPQPRVIVADVTVEKLSDVLEENPRGVLLATDEFSAWLGALDQYKSGSAPGRDRGEWLRLFDGGPHQVERVGRGSKFIPNWGASILTATTPSQMEKFAKHLPEDGLIQRFLIAIAGRQQPTVKPPREEIERERLRYVQTLRRLWSLVPGLHKGVVQMSPAAKARFDSWVAQNQILVEAFGEIEPALAGHLAKYPTFALRIALTLHCAHVVNRANISGPPDPAAHALAVETLEIAFAYLKRSFQHARVMYGRSGSPAMDLARDIALFLLVRPKESGLQRRDLLRGIRGYRDADEHVQAAALRIVVDYGWLRVAVGEGYNKQQPTRFTVNPGIGAKFTALAVKERTRREAVREQIAESVEQRRTEGQ